MVFWEYRGTPVRVPPTADIPYQYKPGKSRGYIVQQVLDEIEPWECGEEPIVTITDFERAMPQIIVPIERRTVIWGKHANHYARQHDDESTGLVRLDALKPRPHGF
ncbi:MAG TPA: hypothetical protein VFH06_00845 [Candidatus Saccharimonadales bacterium]|nr:hypothetical protein [Candidatus Saccharimonadales bacterium]